MAWMSAYLAVPNLLSMISMFTLRHLFSMVGTVYRLYNSDLI
jgi:hypothetical protein